MNPSRFAMMLVLALSLPGCVAEVIPTAPDSPDAVAVAPAISALVDGEVVLFRSQPGESFFTLWMPEEDYVMINGNHPGPNGLEALQISLYSFVGVGTYVLDDDPFSQSGIGIYDRDTLPGHSYWSVGTAGDTAWVDSYDPETGDIEGRFAFRGYPISEVPAPPIEVTHGEFRGQLRKYDPFPDQALFQGSITNSSTGQHLLHVMLEDSDLNGMITLGLGGLGETVTMIAYRPQGSAGEGVQFWLDGFHGVGNYPIVDDPTPGAAMAGYWVDTAGVQTGYWASGAAGGSVNVTMYDTATSRIRGLIAFTGVRGGDSVTVSHAAFSGTVRDYVPSGSATATAARRSLTRTHRP